MLDKNRLILSVAGLMFIVGIGFGALARQTMQADSLTGIKNALSGVVLFFAIGAVCLIVLSIVLILIVLKISRVKE